MSTSRVHLVVSLALLGAVGCATAEENNDGGSGTGAAPGTGAGEIGGAPGQGGSPATSGDGGMASMTTSFGTNTSAPNTNAVVDGAGGSTGAGMCEQFACIAMCLENDEFGQCMNGECVCGSGFPTGGFPTGGFGGGSPTGGFPTGGFGGAFPSGGFGGDSP